MGRPLRSLYICYLTIEDPLVRTQVVAYLEGLAREGHTIHLMTFESALPKQRRRRLASDLLRRGIVWHALRYHKRPTLPATVFDVVAGATVATRLVRRHQLDAVHARNHVPAAMGLIVRRLTGCRLIFDVRGLMADEYVDAGIWRRGGVPYRITRWVQALALRRAAGVVVLTQAVRRHLEARIPPGTETQVIPCCVDLARLDRSPSPDTARAALDLHDRPVMVYVGKFTGWYMEREMVTFFAAARTLQPDLVFLVLTQADPAPLCAELARANVPESAYLITSAEPEEIGPYLAAADFAISFVRPSFSKISSSPTKVAEYLAAGLPVISTAIGDLPEQFADRRLGVLVGEFTPAAYMAAAEEIQRVAADPEAREQRRAVARRTLSLQEVGIPRYDRLYRVVASR